MANMRLDATLFEGVTRLRALIDHPMESGKRADRDGNLIDAEFIQHVAVTRNGQSLLDTNWGPNLSKNPYVSFEFTGANVGDQLDVSWTDNLGNSASKAVIVEDGSS